MRLLSLAPPVALAALVGCGGEGANTASPTALGFIHGGVVQVYDVASDSSRIIQLNGLLLDFQWGKDGIYCTESTFNNTRLVRVEKEFGFRTELIPQANATNLAISPDGELMAMAGDNAIRIVTTKGGVQMNSFGVPGASARTVSWSPDGRKLAVGGQRGTYHIWVMDTDGTGATQVSREDTNCFEPSWSPDSKSLVYIAEIGTAREVVTQTLGQTDFVRLTSTLGYKQTPVWSPDGTKIAFSSNEDIALWANPDIYLMNADGTSIQNITRTPNIQESQPHFRR